MLNVKHWSARAEKLAYEGDTKTAFTFGCKVAQERKLLKALLEKLGL